MMKRTAALALALALASGCRTTQAPIRTHPKDAPASFVLQVFERDARAFTGFKAKVEGNSPRGSFSGVMLLQRPDRFRLQTYKLWVSKLFDLAVVGDDVTLYVPARGKVLRSSLAAGGNKAQAFPAGDLLRALLAPSEPGSRVAREDEGGRWIVERFADGRLAARFELEPRTLLVARHVVYDDGGAVAVDVRLAGHRLIGDVPFPGRMTIASAGRDGALELEIVDVALDPPFQDRHFEVELPPDVVIVDDASELEN